MSNYPLFAFKAGDSILDEASMNGLLALHDCALVYTGTLFDSKTGSGVTENDCAGYDWAIRFQANGTTETGRVELDIASDGSGADLTLEIRSDMTPSSGIDGDVLRSITIPGSWLPATQEYYSIPIPLTGLTSGAYYWLVVRKAGDASNHFHIYGEASQDGSYPVYKRSGSSGAWTAENAVHFRFYAGAVTKQDIQHVVQGNAIASLSYTTEPVTGISFISTIKLAIKAVDETRVIEQTYNLAYAGTLLLKGVNA